MNRWLNQFRLQHEKRVVDVYGQVSFGAVGAPTLVNSPTNNKGILSVIRNSAGNYTFNFGTNSSLPKDSYVKLLCIDTLFDTTGTSGAPASPVVYVPSGPASTSVKSGSVTVQFTNLSGAATDPASGEILYIDFCLGDSSAP